MNLEVTFRHMNARPEIRKRADALFAKLHRFLDESADGQLVITSEAGGLEVELVVTNRGATAKASESDDDMRTALDRAFHRIEDQLRRGKEKALGKRRRSLPPPQEDGGASDEEDWDEVEA